MAKWWSIWPRVVSIIAVVKDAILVATIENPIEPDTHPPIPVQMATSRCRYPSRGRGLVLCFIAADASESRQGTPSPAQCSGGRVAPHLEKSQGGDEAKDIEATGLGLMERLGQIAKNLHGKVSLPGNDPLGSIDHR